MVALILLVMFQLAPDRPQALAIESCDASGRKLFFDSTHSPGEEWFSLHGRVLVQGQPVCGASVSVKYATPDRGSAELAPTGPISPSGLNGEFVLDNIRKGVPFLIVVNPYAKLEIRAVRDGLPAAREVLAKERNLRAGGVVRYVSDELKSADRAGLLSMDIDLQSDVSAVGVVVGTAESFEGVRPANARILVTGQPPIDAPVDSRTGRFVAFGVPAGEHTVRCEIVRDGQLFIGSRTVTAGSAAETLSTVEIKGYVLQK